MKHICISKFVTWAKTVAKIEKVHIFDLAGKVAKIIKCFIKTIISHKRNIDFHTNY